MTKVNSQISYVVCVENSGYPAALELRKIYQCLPDAQAEDDGLVRVIDESGEDYLYPVRFFMPVTGEVLGVREMPTMQRVFKVFVASPSDLQPEREALESAVMELNQTVGNTLYVRLELIRWEKTVHPAVGSDPQAIVNEQIGDDYDIFIGMLWCRFGQVTPRAESGTLEEFERALERHRRDPSAIEIMFYFKDAPVPPSKVDAEQLKKVQAFRARLESEGLIGTFSSTEEFLKTIRIHLTRVLQGWEQGAVVPSTEVAVEGQLHQQILREPASDEPGFLDLIELGNENFQLTTFAARRIATSITQLGNASTETVDRLRPVKLTTPAGVAEAKRIVNTLAERMNHFADSLRGDIPLIREPFGKAIESIQFAAELLPDFQGDPSSELAESVEMLKGLEATIHTTLEQITSLRHTIDDTPRMTTQYNRAKRNSRDALEQLEITLGEQLRLVAEVRRLQEALLQPYYSGA